MNSAFELNVEPGEIGHLVINLKEEKVNKLSMPVLKELEKIIDDLSKNHPLKALLISSGKEGNFIAGADVKSFEPMFDHPDMVDTMITTGHRVFNKLERLPFPTIALINGACLGGGLELALACTARIATDHPKTLLGLPEVTLGIIPGWGGTQRLPRLVGLMEGVPMILSGRPVNASKAWKIHLVDALVPYEFAQEKAKEFLKTYLTPSGKSQNLNRRKNRNFTRFLLEENPLGRYLFFQKAEKELLRKTKGHYPAPEVALKLIKETCTLSLQTGLTREMDTFRKNFSTTFSGAKKLIKLFFVQEALKKDAGIPLNGKPLSITHTGVIGAGIMGSGLIWLLSNNNYSVRFKDIDWKAVGKGYNSVSSLYTKLVQDKKLKRPEANLKFNQISGTIDDTGFKHLNFVIEAAVENLELKQKIFKELEDVVPPETLIATNTSSLTVKELSQSLRHPERFIGMHFFNPVNRMPLVEIVPGVKTSPEMIATAIDLCRKLGKTPIVVGDCTGFLVNRIFIMALNEVLWLLQEGADFHQIEKALLDFGMPMSPFLLADEVGNDTGHKAAKTFEKAYGERMKTPQILERMYERHLYGKKSGKGFYLYEGKATRRNPEIDQLIKDLKPSDSKNFSTETITNRVLLSMINEAAKCLQENIVKDPAYLDMALIMGIGFPPFRGGLLRYADDVGIDSIVTQLESLQVSYGIRFQPSELLLDKRQKHQSFYP